MARTRRIKEAAPRVLESFSFEDRTYQIDPERKKVYCRFVEIETSRASTILMSWREQLASA